MGPGLPWRALGCVGSMVSSGYGLSLGALEDHYSSEGLIVSLAEFTC